MSESKPADCPKCGGEARVMTSNGGFTLYWRVECVSCGFNSRGRGRLRGLVGLGIDHISDSAPQNSREEALERWNEKRALLKATPEQSDV